MAYKRLRKGQVYMGKRAKIALAAVGFLIATAVSVFMWGFREENIDMELDGVLISDRSVGARAVIKGKASYRLFDLYTFDGVMDIEGVDLAPRVYVNFHDGMGYMTEYEEGEGFFNSLQNQGAVMTSDFEEVFILLDKAQGPYFAATADDMEQAAALGERLSQGTVFEDVDWRQVFEAVHAE